LLRDKALVVVSKPDCFALLNEVCARAGSKCGGDGFGVKPVDSHLSCDGCGCYRSGNGGSGKRGGQSNGRGLNGIDGDGGRECRGGGRDAAADEVDAEFFQRAGDAFAGGVFVRAQRLADFRQPVLLEEAENQRVAVVVAQSASVGLRRDGWESASERMEFMVTASCSRAARRRSVRSNCAAA
jgi:hypothetical protein